MIGQPGKGYGAIWWQARLSWQPAQYRRRGEEGCVESAEVRRPGSGVGAGRGLRASWSSRDAKIPTHRFRKPNIPGSTRIMLKICALSELEKKPGFGADIFSGIGGHEVLYLNGVCRRKDTAYPVLGLCDQAAQQPAGDGVGLSSNAHYSNAVWAAIEGRDFFFTGGVDASRTLDRETYRAVQAQAASTGIYSAISFHDSVFDGMPTGFTRSAFKYEISVATDYAIAFGRNRYCGRVPLGQGSNAENHRVFEPVESALPRGAEDLQLEYPDP